jgi:asparagine synthase (glutamine-hydrolysing)
MCGIAGQFGVVSAVFSREALERLKHRGPDGNGAWEGDRAVLVHTRLAIIELSEAGRQPMVYGERSEIVDCRSGKEDEDVCFLEDPRSTIHGLRSAPSALVFNGEIYNHRELRAELEEQGETFVGHSDTEVLLRLLVREGEACLPKLAGMFAFAFWDETSASALLARDPLGIKPLYYRLEEETLSFASETRVLRKDGDLTDASALRDFFLWGSVPEPATLNSAIRQIPAGHCLKWKDGKSEMLPWNRTGGRSQKSAGKIHDPRSAIHDLQSSISRTREALLESIRRHLVSDVPVGIFLSGGIDSTAILALTREVLGRDVDIRTFSIGFDDTAFDESTMARHTADHFRTLHTEWMMKPAEGAAEIPEFLAAVDQPSIDGFNTWCVSKLARREGMKVVLSGLGGDEWFAGYGSFQRVPRFRRIHRMLGPFRPLAAMLLETRQPGSPWRRLAAFLRGGGTWLEAFHAQRGIFTPEEAQRLAGTLAGASPRMPDWELPDLPDDPRAIVSELELTRYMRNQLLRDSDVFSMAHGLELRVPFVDARLAQVLQSTPPEIRLREGKQLLLEAVPEIPEWVRNQTKRGFRFPFQQWMEGQFGESLKEAQEISPVQLNAWYRTWAVALAIRGIR